MNRRQFLARSAAVATTATLNVASIATETMRTRLIPGTDEALPVIGLGAPRFFSTLPPEGKAAPMAVIQAMLDAGGRVIDTPPFFRPNVPVLGDLINEMGVRDELFLTTKITVSGKQAGVEHLEKAVAALNKKPMDVLMVHNMRDMDNHWPTLRDWKDAGRTRYIGVSLTRVTEYSRLINFMNAARPDFIFVGYSIHNPLPDVNVLPLAADLGIAVICGESFKTDADGNYFAHVAGKELPAWAADFDCESWAQFQLKWIVAHPAVTCVVTETSKVRHATDNMGAGHGRLPDAATRERMSEYLLSL